MQWTCGWWCSVLSPGVQHRDRADLGAKVAGVVGDVAQGLGRRPEQDAVHHLLVVEGDLGDLRRQGEHDVEVWHRQQVGLSRLQPVGARQALALRAMAIPARVEGVTSKPAIGALLHVPAQRGGAACFDRRHHAAPGTVQVVSVGVPIGRAVEAKNIRHLQRRAHPRHRLQLHVADVAPPGDGGRSAAWLGRSVN